MMHGHGGGMGGMMGGGHRGMTGRLGDDEEVLGKPYDHRVVTRLLGYVAPQQVQALLAVLTMVLYTGTVVAIPWLVRVGIDRIIDGDSSGLNVIVIAAALVAFAGWVTQYVHLILMAKVSQGVLYRLRLAMFGHLQRLSLRFYDKNEVGRIMSRIQNDVLTLQDFLSHGVVGLADLLSLVGIIIALFLMDPALAALTLSVAPVLVVGLVFWQRRARGSFIRVRQAIATVNAGLQENISGVRVIQSLNREDENSLRFDRMNRRHLEANLIAGRLSAIVLPGVELLMAVAIAVVVIYGGRQVLGGSLEVGVLVAFALYIQRFFDPIRTLTMQYTELQRSMASGARIFELMDTDPDLVDAPDARKIDKVKGEVRFDHVSHSYVPGVEVLHDLDLHVGAGETVALVGQTGAGKTTVTALIARLYDASEGSVTIDGIDVRTIERRSLAKHVTMVLQDPFLFWDTVLENIRYGRLDASREEVELAAKTVGAHDFIMRLEHGYDTLLQERGGNLSVGQRQLVSFARAVLADPAILILDEATANIDTQTEVLIQQALGKLLHGRTSVLIAHRLSTIRNADRIVVMDQGRIVEMGSHDELMARNGVYRNLYTMSYETGSPSVAS
jgi:ATP-binding cassette subfamily B multidrug efflux pump